MALNFCEPCSQVTSHDEFYSLDLHLIDIDVKAIIDVVLPLRFNHLLATFYQSEHTFHQIELKWKQFWRHLLIVQQSDHLEHENALITI